MCKAGEILNKTCGPSLQEWYKVGGESGQYPDTQVVLGLSDSKYPFLGRPITLNVSFVLSQQHSGLSFLSAKPEGQHIPYVTGIGSHLAA